MEDDRNAPATKGDLADQETRIVDRLTEAIRMRRLRSEGVLRLRGIEPGSASPA